MVFQCDKFNMASFPFRYVIALMALGSILTVYIGRLNLAIAIVHMSSAEKVGKNHAGSSDVCPSPTLKPKNTGPKSAIHLSKSILNNKNITTIITRQDVLDEKFDWDETVQGHILSAFFYGYILTQVPMGIMANRFGPRYICAAGIIGTGVINLVTPSIVDRFWLFIGSRFLMGLLQSGMFSCIYAFVSRWIPDGERSTVISVGAIGAALGSIITSSMTGYLCKHHGWPSVFYISGCVITVFGALYVLLMTNDPKDHIFVTKQEYAYIVDNISALKAKQSQFEQKQIPFPWLKVLSSVPVWAMIWSQYSMLLLQNVVIYKTSAYMAEVLQMSIDEIGYYSSAIFLVKGFSYFMGGISADFVLKRNYFSSKTKVRKIFQSISAFGASSLFLLIPLTNCNKQAFITVILVGMLAYGMATGGEHPVPTDMSNRFAPTLFSIANMICTTAGFVPEVMGPLLDAHPGSVKHTWWYIFGAVGLINIVGGAIFLIWGSAEPQNWEHELDRDDAKQCKNVNNPVDDEEKSIPI